MARRNNIKFKRIMTVWKARMIATAKANTTKIESQTPIEGTRLQETDELI